MKTTPLILEIWGDMCPDYDMLCPTCVAWDLYYQRSEDLGSDYVPDPKEVQRIIELRGRED